MGRLGISFLADKRLGEYTELAKLIESYRFETISVYEDLLYQPPWAALFQFALHTRHSLLGPAVVNPYLNHPVPVAANLAVLDEVSGGRAYLGVGKGGFFEHIGVPQPRPLRAIREMVEAVQLLLTGEHKHEPYRGQIFRLGPEAYLRFPIPGRRLPVLIGTWGKKTSALAGEIADMVKIGGCVNPENANVFRSYIDRGTKRAGRDRSEVRLLFGAVTVVDRDRKRAERLARSRVAMYVAVVGRLDPTYSPPADELETIERSMSSGDVDGAARAISDETLRRFSCFGTPADIVRRMEELFDAGVDVFEFGSPHGEDEAEAIRLLGDEVLPAFKT
jgi:5,10-methylenetetrahydromethanopterin reductase